jgi:hypothetical protein
MNMAGGVGTWQQKAHHACRHHTDVAGSAFGLQQCLASNAPSMSMLHPLHLLHGDTAVRQELYEEPCIGVACLPVAPLLLLHLLLVLLPLPP